jgi:hypothetical protein
MRAFSIRRRNQLPPNIFIRLWRRWMAAHADQLLEAARLGSDKVEYLTHGQEMSNAEPDPFMSQRDFPVETVPQAAARARRRVIQAEIG